MGKGYPVPCSGGCGRQATQYTVGQQAWCEECSKHDLVWNTATGRFRLAPGFIAIGTPVVPNTPGHPGHNRIGVVSGIRMNPSNNTLIYLVDFEGGHDIPATETTEAIRNAVEDCGEYPAEQIKPWGRHR